MSPGIHPFADAFIMSRLETPSERSTREKTEAGRLFYRMALSTLPLIGLAIGVVAVALRTA